LRVERSERISVVVITRNRRDELCANLPRLLSLPEQPPVVVIDNGSTDGTAAAARHAAPDATVIELAENLGAAGRNVGVATAQTPYIAFADDDSWWEPGALARAADLLDEHPRVALLAAQVLVGRTRALDPVCAAMAHSPLPRDSELPGPSVLGFVACGAVVRRSAFLRAGGFHPMFGVGGEEELLALDLRSDGWGLVFTSELTARHQPSPQRSAAVRRRRVARNALWTAWLRRRLPSAVRETARVLADASHDRAVARGVLDAVAAAPRILRGRRPVSRALEAQVRLLEAARAA
jgi:GT2 family glycosyltransferase